MSTDLTSLIADSLHNEGDGGIWESFDRANAEKVATVLDAVIEASDWLREQRARELEATAEAIDRRARVVERRHVAEALRNRAQAIREGRA